MDENDDKNKKYSLIVEAFLFAAKATGTLIFSYMIIGPVWELIANYVFHISSLAFVFWFFVVVFVGSILIIIYNKFS